ncbi:MAG TPA: DUF5666 domain-containing protein [Pseudonocardiaceae bacterium]|jgi:hypothetical protein|nr:DUF5666 domain-containing protein [Pseudonocardiaceae bacterium]
MRINRHLGRVGGAMLGLAAIGLVLTGCGSSSASPAPTTAPATTTTPTVTKHAHAGISGNITAENSTNWTVQAQSGKQYTVIVGPNTQFGTKKTPATRQQFTVGEKVRVAGAVQGRTVTATRIEAPATASAPSTSTPPTTTASPTATTA